MKKELILSVGDVFDLIFKGVKPLDEALQDTLANIIMITYLLAKRLGISFSEIDYKIKEKDKNRNRSKSQCRKLVWRFFKFKNIWKTGSDFKLNNKLRLPQALLITALGILLCLMTAYKNFMLSILSMAVPVPYAIIGTLTG